ncbi:dCMP deaminase [Micromonospora chokoriensis]|uniref:dCMP deaminase n=1 Tax=Micromonospora chokoriensis TaxID=356851 RepID=UPI0004C386C7|nr:dCMP deaminase [Micromonospora chokoriensis]
MSKQQEQDRRWLQKAVELSRRCPPTMNAYAVGAVLVDPSGRELATGYSREDSPAAHAEQVALTKLGPIGPVPTGSTLYTSMEPCSSRRSYPVTCTEMIVSSGISRVVLALREPPLFVRCVGVQLLRQAGVEVVEIPDLSGDVLAVNAAVLNLDI